MIYTESIKKFTENGELSKTIQELLEEAYKKGFSDGCKEEWNNDAVFWCDRFNGDNYYMFQYNYGATCEMDTSFGSSAGGKMLTYEEAMNHPFYVVPTKKYIETLFNGYNKVFSERNWGVRGNTYNERAVICTSGGDRIAFYGGRCYDENDSVGKFYDDINNNRYLNCCHIWLADEVDEDTALSVIIPFNFENEISLKCGSWAGEYKGEILPLIFVAVPKKYRMQVHYCIDRYRTY